MFEVRPNVERSGTENAPDSHALSPSLETLAFTLLTAWLGRFHTESFLLFNVTIKSLSKTTPYVCVSEGDGEKFDIKRHTQGTEVKAVTYSNLQVNVGEGRTDIYVIVDI